MVNANPASDFRFSYAIKSYDSVKTNVLLNKNATSSNKREYKI